MKNIKFSKVFLVTSLLLTIPLALVGCSKVVADNGENDASSVKVSDVKLSTIESDVEYGSKLASSTEIQVISKVAGKVDSIKVEVGSHVKKGDILATIDSKELQAQYKQVKGAYDSANANYVKTADSGFEQQVSQAKSSVDTLQIQYDDAKNTLDRIQREYNIGDSSKQDLDAAKAKVDNLASQLNSAKDSLNLLESKSGPQANAAAAAQVTQAEGNLEATQIQLDNTTIIAPVDGVIATKTIDIGSTISNGASVFTITDSNSLMAEVNMTDKSVVNVQKGQKIPVKISAFGDKVFDGMVDSISPNADAKTNLYSVKVRVDNKDNSIKADMITKLTFPNEKKNDVLVVSREAVFIQNSVNYVYAVQDGKLKRIEVETGISNASEIEIKSGLKQGDQVVTEGQNFLKDGQSVNIATS
jgi:multidrug efflux pump subunit AcrA (membrane-fusion protein)